MDQKLLWNSEIKHIVSRCEKGINLLRQVCGLSWGAHQNTALLFYKCYIRLIIDYGSIWYGSACKTLIKEVDKVQYKALRIALGAMKSTPTEALLVEALEPPLWIRREYLSCKFLLLQASRNNHLYRAIYDVFIYNLTATYFSNKNNPPLAKAFETCNDLNLCTNIIKYESVLEMNPINALTGSKCIFPSYNGIPKLIFFSMADQYPNYTKPTQMAPKQKTAYHVVFTYLI